MIVNGTINGLAAWWMYGTTNDDITLWSMPSTLSGDLFVTTVIQSVLTWILVGIFVRGDIRRGCISYISPPTTQEATQECCRSVPDWMNLKQYPISCDRDRCVEIARNMGIYTMMAIVLFVVPSFIALAIIKIAVDGVDDALDYKMMIAAKTCFAGIMGLVMTPIAAISALTHTPGRPRDGEESEIVEISQLLEDK